MSFFCCCSKKDDSIEVHKSKSNFPVSPPSEANSKQRKVSGGHYSDNSFASNPKSLKKQESMIESVKDFQSNPAKLPFNKQNSANQYYHSSSVHNILPKSNSSARMIENQEEYPEPMNVKITKEKITNSDEDITVRSNKDQNNNNATTTEALDQTTVRNLSMGTRTVQLGMGFANLKDEDQTIERKNLIIKKNDSKKTTSSRKDEEEKTEKRPMADNQEKEEDFTEKIQQYLKFQETNKTLTQENRKLAQKIEKLLEDLNGNKKDYDVLEAKYVRKTEKLDLCETKLKGVSDYQRVIVEKDAIIKELTEAVSNLKISLKESIKEPKSMNSIENPTKLERRTSKRQKDKVMVIKINSLSLIKEGWEVQTSKNMQRIEKNTEFQVFGMIGLKATGKSFIINKFIRNLEKFEESEYIQTKGLNILKLSESNTICLDSEGIGSAVEYYSPQNLEKLGFSKEDLKENDELLSQMMTDRILTDLFLNDLIYNLSNVFIIVVEGLSQREQKIIERARDSIDLKKKIIVVHNYKNVSSIDVLEEYIERYIKNCFCVTKTMIPQTDVPFFIEKRDRCRENILHFVLAKENSEAGNIFNKSTFQQLKKILDTSSEKRKFDFYNEMIEFFEINYRRYFKFTKAPAGVKLKVGNDRVYLDVDGEFQIANPLFNDYLTRFNTNPPFEVYEGKEGYECLIEISDLEKNSLNLKVEKRKNKLNLLVVRGSKRERIIKEGESLFGNRKTGEFLFEIPLGERKISVEGDVNYKYKKGVLTVEVFKKPDENVEL